jgi:hypothetical protein
MLEAPQLLLPVCGSRLRTPAAWAGAVCWPVALEFIQKPGTPLMRTDACPFLQHTYLNVFHVAAYVCGLRRRPACCCSRCGEATSARALLETQPTCSATRALLESRYVCWVYDMYTSCWHTLCYVHGIVNMADCCCLWCLVADACMRVCMCAFTHAGACLLVYVGACVGAWGHA